MPWTAAQSISLPEGRKLKAKEPSATARGYGIAHQRQRKALEPGVATGLVRCARGKSCKRAELIDGRWVGGLILPDEPWDLGHVDGSGKRLYSGPEHRGCNRATATHRRRRQMSREW